MQWRKPANMRYTELCIFIDQNITKIINPGENPDLENKIYNYLWLLVKALAIKKNMFKNFQDYDPYAFYSANRLFFALRKNLINQGKTIKGKAIKPIKSCLNYTKALLYPMKVEYQREAYREIIDEEFVSKKFDAFTMKEKMLEEARSYQVRDHMVDEYLIDTLKDCGNILNTVLKKLPFTKTSPEYKYIRMSLLLNCINNIQQKKKLDADLPTILVWHLPKSMANYIRVLLKEFYKKLASEIMDSYNMTVTDRATLEKILSYREGADYDYDAE